MKTMAAEERFEIVEFNSGFALENGETDMTTVGVAIWDNLTDSPYRNGDNQMIGFGIDEFGDNGLPLGVEGAKLKLGPILKEVKESQAISDMARELQGHISFWDEIVFEPWAEKKGYEELVKQYPGELTDGMPKIFGWCQSIFNEERDARAAEIANDISSGKLVATLAVKGISTDEIEEELRNRENNSTWQIPNDIRIGFHQDMRQYTANELMDVLRESTESARLVASHFQEKSPQQPSLRDTLAANQTQAAEQNETQPDRLLSDWEWDAPSQKELAATTVFPWEDDYDEYEPTAKEFDNYANFAAELREELKGEKQRESLRDTLVANQSKAAERNEALPQRELQDREVD